MIRFYYKYNEFRQKTFKKNPFISEIISLGLIILWVLAFRSIVLSANNIPSGSMIPTLKIGDFLFVNRMRYSIHLPFTDKTLFHIDKPGRGDIVVFNPSSEDRDTLENRTLVKRVVGLPGDEIFIFNNEIFINDLHFPVKEESDRSILDDLDYPKAYKGTADILGLYKEKILNPETGELEREHYIVKEKSSIYNEFISYESQILTYKTMKGEIITVDKNSNDFLQVVDYSIIPENKYWVMGDNRTDSHDSRFWTNHFVDINDIHGKVWISYFSVNWGGRHQNDEYVNPFVYLFRLITFKLDHEVYVRWDRAGERLF